MYQFMLWILWHSGIRGADWHFKQFANDIFAQMAKPKFKWDRWFTPCSGLCENYGRWVAHRYKGNATSKHLNRCGLVLHEELNEYSKKKGRFRNYPFNEDPKSYIHECSSMTIFTNIERLNWLRKKAK